MKDFAKRLGWLWRTLRRSKQVEAEMRDELRLPIDLET